MPIAMIKLLNNSLRELNGSTVSKSGFLRKKTVTPLLRINNGNFQMVCQKLRKKRWIFQGLRKRREASENSRRIIVKSTGNPGEGSQLQKIDILNIWGIIFFLLEIKEREVYSL